MPSRATCNRSFYFGQSRKVSIFNVCWHILFLACKPTDKTVFFCRSFCIYAAKTGTKIKEWKLGAEDIVAKLPEFLQFVKQVQSVISGELRHSNVDTWKFNQPVISDMIHQIKGSSTTLSCSSMRYIFSREDNVWEKVIVPLLIIHQSINYLMECIFHNSYCRKKV